MFLILWDIVSKFLFNFSYNILIYLLLKYCITITIYYNITIRITYYPVDFLLTLIRIFKIYRIFQ